MGPVPYLLFKNRNFTSCFFIKVCVFTIKLHTVSNGNDYQRIASLKPNMVPDLVNC
jgi:hypothetical protein